MDVVPPLVFSMPAHYSNREDKKETFRMFVGVEHNSLA